MAADPLTPATDLAQRFMQLSLAGSWLESARVQAESLAPQLDWTVVRDQAAAERLAPLLHHRLQNYTWLPAELVAGWRQAYRNTERWNLLTLFELGRVVRRLREHQVEAIVLKGAALIPTVYGNIGLRPLRDLDLLIRPGDLGPTLDCLRELRYERLGLEQQPGSLAAYESQARLRRRGVINTVIEVHWSLFDSPHHQARLALDWFWDTRITVAIGGAPALAPGPSAHLLYLAGHLWLHHHGIGLLWWNDMAELVVRAQEPIAWSQMLRWAKDYDLVLPLQQVLASLAVEWGAPVPADVLQELSLLRPKKAEQRVFDGLAGPGRPAGPRLWLDVISLPGWRQRLHFAWGNLVPSPAYMRRRYHIPHVLLTPLYYPYRWLLGVRSTLWKF